MITMENGAQLSVSAARDIEMVAELAIAHLTHSWMLREHYRFSDPHPDYERDEITQDVYLEAAVEATQSRCALLSAWTGIFLCTAFPGRFTSMFLFRSRIANDTPQGLAESEDWSFDTWLMLQDADGKYYTLSPPLHDQPEGGRLVEVFESDTQEGAVAHVHAQRPGWDWASSEQTKMFTAAHNTEPDSFCAYDATQEKPHAITCITLVRQDDQVVADPARLLFKKLDVYA